MECKSKIIVGGTTNSFSELSQLPLKIVGKLSGIKKFFVKDFRLVGS